MNGLSAFSFPLQYFDQHRLPLDWQSFLDDFQRHWPANENRTYVDFIGAVVSLGISSPQNEPLKIHLLSVSAT
jgi:hypothetical protein